MAKIHKIEAFILDANDRFSSLEELLNYIDLMTDISMEIKYSNSSSDFEWNDDLTINKLNCTINDYEEYFK